MPEPKYRKCLPQLQGKTMLTDGGLETCLIFHDGIELPYFAAFDLLRNQSGRETLKKYYHPYIDLALKHGTGLVLETPTWRANRNWGDQLGYNSKALVQINLDAVEMLCALRDQFEAQNSPMVVSGNIGPRGDGYVADNKMDASEAENYHMEQIKTFAGSSADMIAVLTMNYVEEALGVARAAAAADIPACIAFTVETDGRLPSGQPLGEAIEQVDHETSAKPAYYMVNCAHPSHFESVLKTGEDWTERVWAVRANASCMSHAELDEAETLDEGDPEAFGRECTELRQHLPNLSIFGGCCGTDHRHVASIAQNLKM